MWPMLLDMSRQECKNELRKLELEAYSVLISAFRAQGGLTRKKILLLNELESILKISSERSKAEMRRACNDEKLFTIAKKLSHSKCSTNEWSTQSKRLIPMLPRLQQTSFTSAPSYYRILADHILNNSKPILNLYAEPSETSFEEKCMNIKIKRENNCTVTDDKCIKPSSENDRTLYLANGYAVSSSFVQIYDKKPSEFVSEYKSTKTNEENSFLKNLIQKYKKQKEEKERTEEFFIQNAQKTQQTEPKKSEKSHTNKTVKNSKLISQMIDRKNDQKDIKTFKTYSATSTIPCPIKAPTPNQPPTTIKISPNAKIIRLDPRMYMPCTGTISLINNNSHMPTSLQINSTNQNNTLRIVKILNTQQPILNGSN